MISNLIKTILFTVPLSLPIAHFGSQYINRAVNIDNDKVILFEDHFEMNYLFDLNNESDNLGKTHIHGRYTDMTLYSYTHLAQTYLIGYPNPSIDDMYYQTKGIYVLGAGGVVGYDWYASLFVRVPKQTYEGSNGNTTYYPRYLDLKWTKDDAADLQVHVGTIFLPFNQYNNAEIVQYSAFLDESATITYNCVNNDYYLENYVNDYIFSVYFFFEDTQFLDMSVGYGSSFSITVYDYLNYGASQDAYIAGYQDGYANGKDDGYNEGFQNGVSSGESTGYANGYADALSYFNSHQSQSSFMGLMGAIADTPLRMLYSLFNFDLFGTTVTVAILSLVTGIIIIGVVKKFIK